MFHVSNGNERDGVTVDGAAERLARVQGVARQRRVLQLTQEPLANGRQKERSLENKTVKENNNN